MIETVKKRLRNAFLIVGSAFLVAGCGGGGGTTVPSIGYVIDSPVAGLTYTCGVLTGTTGSDGSFHYDAGTGCSFTVGKVTVGTIAAIPSDGVVTPHDLAGVSRADALNSNAISVAQFLQSLDDGAQSTHINIPASVVAALANVAPTSVIPSALAPAQIQTQLATLVSTATGGARTLVSAGVAAANLNTYLQAAYPNLSPSAGVMAPSASSSSDNAPKLAAAFPATLTASNTSVGFSATADVNAVGYWEILPATAGSPNQWQVISGLDSKNAAVALSGKGNMAAATTATFNITGLDYSSSYKLYFVAANAGASSKVTQVYSSSITTGTAPQPPNLSPSSISTIHSSDGSAAFSLTSDVTGTGYWVVLSAGAAPTAAQVVAGTDSANAAAPIKGSTQLSGGSATRISVSGLAYSTSYTLYFAAANLSDTTKVSQVLSVPIQTGPPPPPNITAISASVTPSGTTAVFSVTVNAGATGYWLALDATATSPTAAQIMAGTDASGSAAPISGKQAIAAATATNISVANLAYSTTYKIYFVASTSTSGASVTAVQSIAVATTAAAPATTVSLAGSVIDGKVSGATLTLYSDRAMTTQVGTGSTDSTGAFSITLTAATTPDPVYIKSAGGTDIDTGMPAPTLFSVGNTAGTNALTTFNVTPLTKDVFDRVSRGNDLATAQSDAKTAFGLTANTGANGLYEDPTAAGNTGLKAAAFKKLAAGTAGSTITAGNYKMFAITISKTDVGSTTVSSIANLVASSNFVAGDVSVTANGDITGTVGSSHFITGKVIGSSMLFNVVDSTTAPTSITRVVGNIGLNGSFSGNFTDVSSLTSTPVMDKGIFVGSMVPATGINAAGLGTFISGFYNPGATSGNMNIVARHIFSGSGEVPRVNWGQAAVTAVDVSAGTAVMGNMTMTQDAGSSAGATSTYTFSDGEYLKSGGIPTNLLVFHFTDATNSADIYIVTAVGLRRGIYFAVSKATNKIELAGESYMSKVDSVAPKGFTAGATEDVTVAGIHPAMPGQSRTAILSQGLLPTIAVSGGMAIPANVDTSNGYTVLGSELAVFQGSMFVMKQDANNDFLDNQLGGGSVDDHLRVVEFYESGAMQGEEILGGTFVPAGGSSITLRDYPMNFVGFVHNRADATLPSFTGSLNFLARTIYASSYLQFGNAYTFGTLSITAPTTTAGSATLVATPAGGTAATSTLTVDVPATGAPGVYHIHGVLSGSGGRYVDITWPIGGTKALYAVSASASGTVEDVGEAYITQ